MWRRRVPLNHAVEVVPPRGLESSMSAARTMLGALSGESFTLEIAVSEDGPRYFVRAADPDALGRVVTQLRAAYPQAEVVPVPEGVEAVPAGAAAFAATLRAANDTALPIRLDWRGERDPLSAVVSSVQPASRERIVLRLSLAPAGARSADGVRRRQEQASYERRAYEGGTSVSLAPVVAFMALAAGGLQGWQWYEAGEWGLIVAAGAALFVGLPLVGAIAMRFLRGDDPLPRPAVSAKLGAPLMSAGLVVLAVAPDASRARTLAAQTASAYAAFDDAHGGGIRAERPRRVRPEHRPRDLPLLLSTAEAGALWHLPEALDGPALVRRTTAQRLAPSPGHVVSGIRVGYAPVAGRREPVHLPARLLHRNHLIVAKTRRGKSTLLRHLAAGLMERIAAGDEDSAIVVVDPHQDLAEAVLASVPDALVDRTVYIDFAHLDRPIALNLLDTDLFPDRDRTVEGIVTMMARLWPDNWGPRMEGALRASLSALHELNTKRSPVEQFTLLDVAPFLTSERMRGELLPQVEDVAVRAWWRDNYDLAGQVLRQQTANPVTSKVGRFTVTQAARFVFGQSRSTFNPRDLLRDGGVLVINTAVGTLGEGAASLVGASVLNLLGLIVEEQVQLPPEQRRSVVQLVDESSTLGAVDYARMLSELGKYGASYTLVTQSLSKLDAVDRELLPTILSNSDALTVFQASAEDARRLLPELGGDLEIEDLVSLNDYSAYARWWDGFSRPAPFTLSVDAPPAIDTDRARAIARHSAERYGRPREQVMEEVRAALAARFADLPEDGREELTPEEIEAIDAAPAPDRSEPTGKVEVREPASAAGPPVRTRNPRRRVEERR